MVDMGNDENAIFEKTILPMSTLQLLHDKAEALPESAREELLDYAGYLSYKYEDRQNDDEEYDRLLEQLLTQRMEHFRKHPETAVPSEEFEKEVRKKYGWPKRKDATITETVIPT